MKDIGLTLRCEARFWPPVIWSADDFLQREHWTIDGFVDSNLLLSVEADSKQLNAVMEYVAPGAHRTRRFTSFNSVYRWNNPFGLWRALHAVASPLDGKWISMPERLLLAAIYLFSHEEYFHNHSWAIELRQALGETVYHEILKLVPPKLDVFLGLLYEADIPVCRQSFDLELAMGTISGADHQKWCNLLIEQVETKPVATESGQLQMFDLYIDHEAVNQHRNRV